MLVFNAINQEDWYPLTLINSAFVRLQQVKISSKLDLYRAYNLATGNEWKRAFITLSGHTVGPDQELPWV